MLGCGTGQHWGFGVFRCTPSLGGAGGDRAEQGPKCWGWFGAHRVPHVAPGMSSREFVAPQPFQMLCLHPLLEPPIEGGQPEPLCVPCTPQRLHKVRAPQVALGCTAPADATGQQSAVLASGLP